MSTDNHFLSRWARRKAGIAAQAANAATAARPQAGTANVSTTHANVANPGMPNPDVPNASVTNSGVTNSSVPNASAPDDGTPPPPATEPEGEFDLTSLTALDDITAQTDIRPFMHRLVPADLRNAALRRMWELDPSIRDYVSPATEYAWNFNVEGGAPGYGPLDTGFDAARQAVDMLSQNFSSTTLVEGETADPAGLPLADAENTAAASLGKPITAAPKVMNETVRISTVSPEPSLPLEAAHDPEKVQTDPVLPTSSPALQHNRGRHGGALPR